MLNERVLSNNFFYELSKQGHYLILTVESKQFLLVSNNRWVDLVWCASVYYGGFIFALWVRTYIWHWLFPQELPTTLFLVDSREQVLFLLTPGPLLSSQCKQDPAEPSLLINLSPSQQRALLSFKAIEVYMETVYFNKLSQQKMV